MSEEETPGWDLDITHRHMGQSANTLMGYLDQLVAFVKDHPGLTKLGLAMVENVVYIQSKLVGAETETRCLKEQVAILEKCRDDLVNSMSAVTKAKGETVEAKGETIDVLKKQVTHFTAENTRLLAENASLRADIMRLRAEKARLTNSKPDHKPRGNTPCRYGGKCTNQECSFKHPESAKQQ